MHPGWRLRWQLCPACGLPTLAALARRSFYNLNAAQDAVLLNHDATCTRTAWEAPRRSA
jgi:hypothetical protein